MMMAMTLGTFTWFGLTNQLEELVKNALSPGGYM
jgi:hypothetical protein